ncbi:MAG TPA: hypothetical protein DCF44_09255 [Chitinophagaceae bacterium]|nr:hypothetical protein [Chitinophagaceae bacterium]
MVTFEYWGACRLWASYRSINADISAAPGCSRYTALLRQAGVACCHPWPGAIADCFLWFLHLIGILVSMLVFFTKSNFAVGHSEGQKGKTKSNTWTNRPQYDFLIS